MALTKMDEAIWLSVSCWAEEGWPVNTKEHVSHACFHGDEPGSFSSPSAGSYKRRR